MLELDSNDSEVTRRVVGGGEKIRVDGKGF